MVEPQDPTGLVGALFHYLLVFVLVGGALLTFLYLSVTHRLFLDEDSKWQVLHEEGEDGGA